MEEVGKLDPEQCYREAEDCQRELRKRKRQATGSFGAGSLRNVSIGVQIWEPIDRRKAAQVFRRRIGQ